MSSSWQEKLCPQSTLEMKFILAFLAVALLFTSVLAGEAGAPSDVVILTQATLDEQVKEGNWLIEL